MENLKSCPPTEHNDPRVRRTRALLKDALNALMHEKKFHDISVQDIAERATVNRATFYAHYEDKYALLSSNLRTELGAKLTKRFPERPPLTPESLPLLMLAVFEFIGDMRQQCPASAREMENTIGTMLQDEIYLFMDNWLRFGGIPRSLQRHSRETIATTFSWSIFGAAHQWSRGERTQTALEVAEEVTRLLLPEEPALAMSVRESRETSLRS